MRFRDIVGLGIALVLAIGVAFLTRVFLTKKEEPKQELIPQEVRTQTTKVLVAAKTLREGDKIQSGDFIWQEWPQAALNVSYITEQSLASQSLRIENFVGSIVREELNMGEPITLNDFIKPGDKSALAALVSPGKRAVSIDVSSTTASSGLISPSDFVDVILSFTSTTVSGEVSQQITKSETLLKDIKVLAIDTDLSTPQGKVNASPHVATLEVTPDQAEVLMAAVKKGTLSLSLRSLDKEGGAPLSSKQSSSPLSEGKRVTIIRGKDTSTIEFTDD